MDNKLQSAFRYHRMKGRAAYQALMYARGDVAAGRDRYPHCYQNGQPITYGWGNARADDGSVWIERLDAAGLRLVDYADKLASIRHTGWYTSDDNELDESLRGVVVQMSGRDGRPRYLAGYEDPNNPGSYRIAAGEIFEGSKANAAPENAQRDAARAADSLAERSAEQEREYNRAWQAGRRYEDLADDITTTRKGLLSLITEAKAACKERRLGPAVRAAIGDKIKHGLATIRIAREKRGNLLADFGRASGWEG